MPTLVRRLRPSPAAAAAAAHAAPPVDKQRSSRDMDDDVIVVDKPAARWRGAAGAATAAHLGHASIAAVVSAAELVEHNKAMQSICATHAATQSTLLELLANPAVHPSSVSRFLAAFPVPQPESSSMSHGQRLLLAKQCWEHLLDSMDDRARADEEGVYGKMEILRRTQLHCPTEVFRQYCRLEQVQLLVDALGSQVKAGTFLCQLRRSLSADGQHAYRHESRKAQQLQNKLEAADLLMVVHTLGTGNVLSIDAQQLQQLKLVHLARHGSVHELESMLPMLDAGRMQEGGSAAAAQRLVHDLVNSSYQGFPIQYRARWLGRLAVLLRAGADAATVYQPWSCSALHMLFYRKGAADGAGGGDSRKAAEGAQVQAVELLLEHGAKAVLNLADKCSPEQTSHASTGAAPTQRTALLQAASAGRFQVCRALLAAGADADVVDSCGQSMLDCLFYLKHSHLGAHRRATAGYTCMQLYGLVNEFRLHALVTDELEQDCRSCGRCRFLLASCSKRHQDGDSPLGSETASGSDSDEDRHASQAHAESSTCL